MNIITFLDHLQKPDFFACKRYLCFTANDVPIVFFSLVYQRLQNSSHSFLSLDVTQHDIAATIGQLEMSFLGMSNVYWLRNISALTEKDRKKLCSYLQAYQGPHSIIVCMQPSYGFTHPHALMIEVPSTVDKKLCLQLAERECNGGSRTMMVFITKVFEQIDAIPFDTAYVLFRYAHLLGAQSTEFIHHWLKAFVAVEKSLFVLSQYFFSKDSKKFFSAWDALRNDYTDLFWVIFWSEQLWRAHHVIHLNQEKQFAQAKAMAFRLPFSFIQRDWKKYSLPELANAHTCLYQVDYHLKNGGDSYTLDRFYTKFLRNEFAKPL